MTIDSSAVVAILQEEPDALVFARAMDGHDRRIMSTVSVLEVSMVVDTRFGPSSMHVDGFLRKAKVDVIPFDHEQLELARDAFRRYGKGRHKAGLNFGDCIAYALSRWSGEPLLYKGDDFGWTDVQSVL